MTILFLQSRAERMCLFAPTDVRKHITAGANKLWFKHRFFFNERKGSCFTSPLAENPLLPSAANVSGCLALHTCTHIHAYTYRAFSIVSLNGTTKYRPWFHKSCRRRCCVLPVQTTGDKLALCVLSVVTDHQAIPPLD